MAWFARIGLLVGLALVGCSKDPEAAPGSGSTDAGRACVPGELTLEDGTCQAAGVTSCSAGFTADGAGGCNAVLPDAACEKGKLAVPGDAACRLVEECGTDAYGAAPVDATTVFVDAAYAGGGSDGSRAKPFTTLQPAVDAASANALVAIAQGRYTGGLNVTKSVRLWGRCPSLVEISGGTQGVVVSASSEMHALSVTGSGQGVVTRLPRKLLLDKVWIHDTTSSAVSVVSGSDVTLRDSLVEASGDVAVFGVASALDIERSVIRDTRASANGTFGRAVNVQADDATGKRSTLKIAGSLLERSFDFGVFVSASDARIESSVVRATAARKSDGTRGRGIGVQSDTPKPNTRGKLEVVGCVLEGNTESGLFVGGSDATIDGTVIRDTQAMPDGRFGVGALAIPTPDGADRSVLVVRASVVERNVQDGILVGSSDATIVSTIVRDTRSLADGSFGRGISIVQRADQEGQGTATIRGCLVRTNQESGVFGLGSKVEVDESAIIETQPNGRGTFGDGVAVVRSAADAELHLARSRVEANARAGVSSFGAVARVGTTQILCNAFAIGGEALEGTTYELRDEGANRCGCADQPAQCAARTSQIEPPVRSTIPTN